MHAKINEKGYPEFFKKHYIKSEGKLILNPTDRDLRALGYKPLKKTTPPECGENDVLSISYIDSGDFIEEVYSITEVK